MSVLVYKRTVFKEPAVLPVETYNQLKNMLTQKPDFKINTAGETFFAMFKRRFKFLAWSIPLLALLAFYASFFKDTEYLPMTGYKVVVFGIIAFGFVDAFVLISVLLEGTSYANYLNDKQRYFIGMEYAIKQSADYNDFSKLFYGGKTTAIHYKKLAANAIDLNKPPTTTDSILIRIFLILDSLTIVVGLACIAWWVYRYFSEK